MVTKRVLEHMQAIVNKDSHYPIARHFESHQFSDSSKLKYFAIEQVNVGIRGGNRLLRLRKCESRHIIDLGARQPVGHNIDEEMIVHLHTKLFCPDM